MPIGRSINRKLKSAYAGPVYRYTPAMQKALKASIKPEPWMHIIIKQFGKPGELGYIVFVWDTRQIIGEGFVQTYVNRGMATAINAAKERAIDNHMPLMDKNMEKARRANKDFGFIKDAGSDIFFEDNWNKAFGK